MQKFLATLGVIFLVLVVLGGIGIGYFAFRGNTLDKESKAYVDAAIPAIFTNWNKIEFSTRASPEFRKLVTGDQLDQMFRSAAGLGQMQSCDPAEGQAHRSLNPDTLNETTARYTAKAVFERGNAIITLDLIKHGDQWQIGGFFVKAPEVAPK
ncbi:MAG TPA: hypothetical protein VNX27_06120 [Chthoniobacterales bacterium]|nr:hypothetical protein [Chthoniobacterales bacterium]